MYVLCDGWYHFEFLDFSFQLSIYHVTFRVFYHFIFSLTIITCKLIHLTIRKCIVSCICYLSTFLTSLSLNSMNMLALYVNTFMFDIVLIISIIAWFLEWDISHAIFDKLTFNVFMKVLWDVVQVHLYTSYVIHYFSMIVWIWITCCLVLDLITLVSYGIHNL